MSLVGYPDFQEQAQWQSPLASTFRNTINNGQTITFPQTGPVFYNVSNWQSVQVAASHPGGGLDVDLLWYDAIPFTRLLGERVWTTVGANGQMVTVPNVGPYLQILVTNNVGAGATCDVDIAFTNRVAPPFTIPSSAPLVSVSGLVVGAGLNLTTFATYLYAGPASLSWTTGAAGSWLGEVRGYKSDGTFVPYGWFGPRGDPQKQTDLSNIEAPPRRIGINILNFGGVGATWDVALTPDYFR